MVGSRFHERVTRVVLLGPLAVSAVVAPEGSSGVFLPRYRSQPLLIGPGHQDGLWATSKGEGSTIEAYLGRARLISEDRFLGCLISKLRGGQMASVGDYEDEDEDGDGDGVGESGTGEGDLDISDAADDVVYDERSVEWMFEQLFMYQTRTALISKQLASRGYKVREIIPSPRGLTCALSTEERRMDCRMYVEAEVGKKVVAPCKCKGTQKWISLAALNSERRKEPQKWKRCPTCQAPIDYKLYEEHGGSVGKLVSGVLNNTKSSRVVLGLLVAINVWVASPIIHYMVVRIMTSGVLWQMFHRLTFFFYMPLPLKIMGVRYLIKFCSSRFEDVERRMRQALTDVESEILEKRVPVTVEVNDLGEEVPAGKKGSVTI